MPAAAAAVTDALILWTIRVAMGLYAVSLLARLASRRRGFARWSWTIGCLLLFVHVGLAMQFVYRWDHAMVTRETDRQALELTGLPFRGGAYVNYAFMVLWAIDAVFWNLAGDARYCRLGWPITAAVHAFMAFIVFNAVVVFAKTPQTRAAGIVATGLILVAACGTRFRRKARANVDGGDGDGADGGGASAAKAGRT